MTTHDALLNLAAFALQIAVVAAAAAVLLRLLRIPSAGARYACWQSALVVALVMPWLLRSTPPAAIDAPAAEYAAPIDSAAPSGQFVASEPPPVPGSPMPWDGIAAMILAAGMMVRGGWLAVGLWRLGALRRSSTPLDDEAYAETQQLLGTRAAIACTAEIAQPVTFGVWRPVVLLPATLADASPAIRRAVVTHELFHVQRRDWIWVLAEETLRTILWFHPSIAWMTSRIQLAREELVDELTVLATGNRRTYIEALLAFADAGRVRPAPAFARRAHLFTRILGLSKESVMSSSHVIARGAFVMVALAGAGWSASVAFPVVVAAAVVDPTAVSRDVALPAEHRREAAPSAAPAIAVTPQVPRGGGAPRPGPAIVPKPQSAGTAVKPITPENPIPRRLSSVAVPYPASLRGTGARARLGLRVIVDASGSVLDVQNTLFASATTRADAAEERQRMDAFIAEASAAIRQWRYAPPADPPIAFFVAVMFEPDRDGIVAQSDSPLAQASIDIQRGFNDGVLGGLQQRLATLRQTREQLLQRYGANAQLVIAMGSQIADLEAQAERLKQSGAVTAQAGPAAPARPPLVSPSGKPPIRVGGSIAVPQKAKDVRPVYPELAKSVRVQGVVILEAIIDEQGRVADARILRSIPLLDQAALDAVKQWEFTPTLLNGEPVPIIMTMTIQFSLPEPQ